MSNHLISEAYKRQLGSMARNAVMVLLADKASDDGTGIWASKQRMAEELGTSKQTVITTVKSLIADGLLIECGQRKCANGYTIEYAINVKALHQLPVVNSHQSSSFTGQAASPVKQDDLTSQAALPKPSRTPLIGLSDDKPLSASQAKEVLDRWSCMAKPLGLSCWEKLTPKRRRTLSARITEHGFKAICLAIEHVPKSAFLRGETGNWNGANLDFLTRPDTVPKILEGQYDDRQRNSQNASYRNASTGDISRDAIAALGG